MSNNFEAEEMCRTRTQLLALHRKQRRLMIQRPPSKVAELSFLAKTWPDDGTKVVARSTQKKLVTFLHHSIKSWTAQEKRIWIYTNSSQLKGLLSTLDFLLQPSPFFRFKAPAWLSSRLLTGRSRSSALDRLRSCRRWDDSSKLYRHSCLEVKICRVIDQTMCEIVEYDGPMEIHQLLLPVAAVGFTNKCTRSGPCVDLYVCIYIYRYIDI